MATPAGGALRVIRTVTITAVTVGLAVTAHVAAGGPAPRPLGLAGLALGTAYVCAWASRRRLSLPAIAALLATGQWLLHQAFNALEAPACAPVAAADHAGHIAGHAPAACAAPADAAAALAASHAAVPSWAMLAAHALATAVTALALATGERAIWALCALFAALLPVLPRLVVTVVPAAPRAPSVTVRPRPRRVLLLRTSPRRGPPAAAPGPLARLAL
jgi:hypothetical protein